MVDNYHHHQVTRLSNGHYMSLGVEIEIGGNYPLPLLMPTPGKYSLIKKDSATGKLYQQVLTGRVVEQDQKGKVLWSWNSSDYFTHSDLMLRKKANGTFGT